MVPSSHEASGGHREAQGPLLKAQMPGLPWMPGEDG